MSDADITAEDLAAFRPAGVILLTESIDANEVHPRLWVGSQPNAGGELACAGFTHVVLCAEQFQKPVESFPGVTLVHCPFDDVDDALMSGATMALVFATARCVAEAHKRGAVVLVTCLGGINRSAMVAALAMRMLGTPGWIAVERIRSARMPGCLTNGTFLRIVLGENVASRFYLAADPK